MTGGVSAAAGLVCWVAAYLMWTVGNKHAKPFIVALVLAGTVGLLGSPAGHWLQLGVGYLDRMAASATSWLTGVVVVGLVGVIALYVVVMHLVHRTIDRKTLIAAVIAPAAVTSVPGVIGSVGTAAVHAIASGVGMAVTAAFGIH